jgi:hypothetical protein
VPRRAGTDRSRPGQGSDPITYLAPSRPLPKFLIAQGTHDCTALTARQRAAMISQAKDHLDTMINMDMPHSPGTGMGSHMTGTDSPMGGMWR